MNQKLIDNAKYLGIYLGEPTSFKELYSSFSEKAVASMVAPEVVPTELVALIGYVLAEALIAVPEGSSAALVAERMYLSVMPENIGQMLDIAIEPPPPENSLEGKIQCSEEFSSKSLN